MLLVDVYKNSIPAIAKRRCVRWMSNWSGCLAVVSAAFLPLLVSQPLSAQVPAVVANSTSTIASGFSAGPAVTDACGNVYVYESGGTGIQRIQASTGTVTTVIANPQGYQSSGPALYMDAAKQFLYFPDFSNFYTAHFDQLAIVNCAPGSLNTTFANNLGNLGNYYWGTAREVAGDAAGDVFFVTTANVTQAIYEETYNSTTKAYAASQLFTWKNTINWLAADGAGDLFFVDNTTQDVYELANNKGVYPTTPTILVAANHFSNVSGLSFDPAGNLYISDSKLSLVFEVPNENGALNPADFFATASLGVPFKAAVDANHNIYASNYYPGATKVAVGSSIAPATTVGSTGAFSVTYLFNAPVTPTGFAAYTGSATSGPFTLNSKGTCSTATAQAALSNCTVSGTFAPTAVGQQIGVVAFTYASGTLLTDLAGIGQGPAITIDPGTVVPFTTTLSAPAGIAVDAQNNVYVSDTSTNAITVFNSASSTGAALSTGSVKLSTPKGIAVDAAGDVFIADTGNSRIVEVPALSGSLASASTAALKLLVKNPQAVAFDSAGDLVVADTGDNTLLLVPNINGSLSFASLRTIASGLGSPNALAFDASGNLYVSEATNGDVLKYAGPLGSAAGVKVAAGFTTPTGVGTDASGALYVVDSGAGNIDRFPNISGTLGTKTLVGVSVLNPIGIALDSAGNLYVTDTTDDVIDEISRVKAVLQFGGVNVGTTGTQISTINSSGNASVVFGTPDYKVAANPAPGFAVTSDSCAGATVASGSSCSITATYSPTAKQLNAEEDLNLQANGVNGSPVVQLVGTGAQTVPSTLTLALTSPQGATSLNAGQPVSFTATVGTGSSTVVPGGSVKFFLNGVQVGTSQVKSSNGTYTAVITLSSGLSAGNPVVISAVYSGDVINYSSSTATLNEVVNPLGDGITLAVSTQFVSPNSAVDDATVTSGFQLTRAAGVVTAKLSSATYFVTGAAVQVASSADSSFNGVFILTSVINTSTSSTLTWTQGGSPADVSSAVSAVIGARQELPTGPAIGLTATVNPSAKISPTGTLTFYAGSAVLGSASVAPGTFQGSITTTALRAGTSATIGNGEFITTYNITAVYSGDSTYAGGTSNAVPVSVVAPPKAAAPCTLTSSTGAAPTCALNYTGAAFTITPTNPTITIPHGQSSGTVTLTITSYGGWQGVLNFTCSNLPAYSTCNPFPGTPTVGFNTATQTSPASTVAFTINTNVPPQEVHLSSLFWWPNSLCGLGILISRRRLSRLVSLRSPVWLGGLAVLLLSVGAVTGITGCSTGTNPYTTPAGSSTVTVTVHSAQGIGGTSNVQLQDANDPSFTINLVVQ